MTSLLSALSSITLSVSLALGSTVALAAPAQEPPPESDGSVDTGVTEAEKDEAEKLSDQAIAKFQAKDYEGAVSLFKQAYEVDPQPNFLFNIGRVYEEAGDLEHAVEYYGKFVKQPGVDLDSRSVAVERLKVLREILEQTREDKPKDDPKDEPKDEPKVEPGPVAPPVDQDAERKRKAMRGAGFGLAGVGAAALIGGAVSGALAQGDEGKARDAATVPETEALLGDARTKALAADVLYGVGGALLLTGVVLIIVGYSKPKTQRVAFTPSFGPRGAGVDLRVRF